MPMKNPPHPGKVILDECIKPLNLSIAEAAKGLGVNRTSLSRLVNGQIGISTIMAIRLSKGFGGSAESWLRQQMNYDLAQVQKEASKIRVEKFELF
jgi:addiction module HigA family antidote